VKQSVSPDAPMGIGLWLSAQAADKLRHGGSVAEFAAWLRDVGLVPFTLNGFPYGDFHRPAVKHAVYEPKWRHPARAKFTLDLIALQDALLPTGLEGSISTLPLQWGLPPPTREQWQISAANVRAIAERLARLEQERGRLLYVCLEPEPGCLLQRSEDVVRFFEEHLLALGDEARLRRYVRVCHDVCHAAVMFEDQADVLRRYRAAGIGVGKVQVSAAVILDLDALKPGERGAAFDQLRAFAEDRYLHQTMIRRSPDDAPAFFEDLPPALAAVTDPAAERGQWRVHFLVPI
jgi:sugar phosphate isomerase/epimerase